MRSADRYPGAARYGRVLVRTVGLLFLAMSVSVPAVARAGSPAEVLAAAGRDTRSAVATTPAGAVALSPAPVRSPAGATSNPDPTTQPSASASHVGEVPVLVPRFEATSGGSGLQAVLVIAVPAVPAIVMAFVVFWPRTRQPRSRTVTTGNRPGTTSGAGT